MTGPVLPPGVVGAGVGVTAGESGGVLAGAVLPLVLAGDGATAALSSFEDMLGVGTVESLVPAGDGATAAGPLFVVPLGSSASLPPVLGAGLSTATDAGSGGLSWLVTGWSEAIWGAGVP